MAYGSVLGRNTKPQFVPTFAISGPFPGDTVTVSYGGTTVEAVEDNGVWYAKAWAYGSYTVKLTATAGTKTITVNVDEVKLYEVTLTNVNTTLNSNSWDVIRKVADMGTGANYWNVGDRKLVTLNGTVGALTLKNYTTYCFILGFNHNAELEGNNTIHFQFCKTALSGGTDLALVDEGLGSTYSSSTSARFVMNTTQTNSGGWKSCYMRNTICNAFFNVLSTELHNVIIKCDKYTNNIGMNNSSKDAVTATADYSFLLSEYEVYGRTEGADSNEASKQIQYNYYSSGNSPVKYKDTEWTVRTTWWLRSPAIHFTTYFTAVFGDASGIPSGGVTDFSYGFAPAFVV